MVLVNGMVTGDNMDSETIMEMFETGDKPLCIVIVADDTDVNAN